MDEYIKAQVEMIKEAIEKGDQVSFEIHNESHHGQAAVNIMNGLPPDAGPRDVKGRFNDWLQDFLPK